MTSRSTDKFIRDAAYAVLPGHRVVQTTEVARVGAPHVGTMAEATVELIREGEVVKAIDVTCSCGEKIRIWCSYEAEQ